jgi:hypothetical protein
MRGQPLQLSLGREGALAMDGAAQKKKNKNKNKKNKRGTYALRRVGSVRRLPPQRVLQRTHGTARVRVKPHHGGCCRRSQHRDALLRALLALRESLRTDRPLLGLAVCSCEPHPGRW